MSTIQKMAIKDGQVSTVYNKTSSQIECPVCHNLVEFLLGVNKDGGVQGCEDCYKPTEKPEKVKVDDTQHNQVEVFDNLNQETTQGGVQSDTPLPRAYNHQEKTSQLLKGLGIK